MGKVTFVGDSLRGELPLNWYPVLDDQRGHILRRTPGLAVGSALNQSGFVERKIIGLCAADDLYIGVKCDAYDNTLGYEGETPANAYINRLLAPTYVWALNIDAAAPYLQIESNDTDLCVCDGTSVWAIKLGSPFTVTKQDFEGSSIGQADGYMIASVKGTGQFRISGLNDAFTWDPLDYGTAEGDQDSLLRIIVDHRELWAFGVRSTEIYYNSGAADFPYARAAGGFLEHGIAAANSAAKLDNGVFWLSERRQVLRAQGYQPQIVSTRKIDRILSEFTTVSDAVGWGQVYYGHTLYFLVFPTEKRTFVLDVSTSMWHERSWYNEVSGEHDAYLARCYAYFNGVHYVGGTTSGTLYTMSDDNRDDAGTLIRRRIDSPEILEANGRNRLVHHKFELEVEQGLADVTDQSHALEWSDDGGKTWKGPRLVSAGDIGAYAERVIFRKLGISRGRTYRYTTAHKGVDALLGMYVTTEPTAH